MTHYTWTVYSLITLGGALAVLFVVGYVWRLRDDISARYLMYLSLACALWGILSSLEMAATNHEATLRWGELSYIGIVEAPVFMMLFVVSFTRHGRPNVWIGRTLQLISLAMVAIVLTNDAHGLFTVSATFDPATQLLTRTRGPLFVVLAVYAYGLSLLSIALLVASIPGTRGVFYWQRIVVLLSVLIPPVVDFASLMSWLPPPGMEWTPTSFALSCVLIGVAIRNQRLFDLRPVLRSRLLDTMEEAVVLVDEKGRIADYNRAMVDVAPEIEDAVGIQCNDLLPIQASLSAARGEGHEVNQVIEMRVGGDERVFDVRTRPLTYASGRERGHLAVLHDITAEHRLQVERDGLLSDLRTALASVEELGGLIPICANCKKIRDDQGFWLDVEVFLAERQPVELSEAICPDCQAKRAQEAEAERKEAGPAM